MIKNLFSQFLTPRPFLFFLFFISSWFAFGQADLVRWNLTTSGSVSYSDASVTVDNFDTYQNPLTYSSLGVLITGWNNTGILHYRYVGFSLSSSDGSPVDIANLIFEQETAGSNPLPTNYTIKYYISSDGSVPSTDGFFNNSTVLVNNESIAGNPIKNIPLDMSISGTQKLIIRFYTSDAAWEGGWRIKANTLKVTGPPADPPVAENDNAVTAQNTAVDVDILDNDTYETISAITITNPATNGNVTVNSFTNVTYTPDTDYIGSDSFKYTITDGNGTSNEATVNVNITLPTAPTAVADMFSVLANQVTNVNVLANDTQGSGVFDDVIIITDPAHGMVTVNPNNTVAYTPNASYTGTDSFQYNVTNIDNMTSNTVTVTLDVYSPTGLVRWNNIDLSPYLIGSNINTFPISYNGITLVHNNWGVEDQIFHSSGWPSGGIDTSKYVEFTISANPNYKIDLNNFNFYYKDQGGTSKLQVRYSKDDFVTSYTSISETNATTTWTSASANLSSVNPVMPNETVKIRIYVYNSNNAFHIKRIYSTNDPTNYSQTPTITGYVTAAITSDPTDLELNQTLDNYEPNIGDSVVFTIDVENLGPNTASGASVTDQLPAGFSYVSNTASVGSYNTGTGVWTIGSLVNGASATLQITALMQATGPYTNIANVSHSGSDPNSNNNTSDVTPTNVCADCTKSLPTTGDITVLSGEVYCLHSGTFTGTININAGGTVCIAENAVFNPGGGSQLNNGTIINRGTMSFQLYNTPHNITITNYGTFNTTTIQSFAGTIENYGTINNTGGTDFLTGASMINEGNFTSTTFQNFAGTLENTGTFTISNNANFLAGAVIQNYGDMLMTNVTANNATLTNYDSFTANSNFYFLGSSSYLENKSTGQLSLNMTTGNTQIVGQFENDGTAQIKNANSGSGISAVVNNYGTLQIYDNVIFGITTYLTNDNVLEFHNSTSVEFQGPLLQNNDLMTIFNGGNLSLNSSISQMVNNSMVVVGGTVSHNVAGSKIVNNCTIISEDYQLVVGTTENNGLIWVNDEFKLEGDSDLINSTTGFIRGTNFRNSGNISGYGSFYFTGNTNFESAGTFVGNDPASPIQFFDTTQTTGGIFDTSVADNPAINVIRPESMTPYDETSYDCTAPPTTAGYPPQTEAVEINFCEPAALTFDIDDYAEAHEPVEGNDFTLLYSSIRLFDPNDEGNGNTTNLVIAGKGTLTVNTTNGVISFTPNVGFTSGSLEAQYRIANEWDGNPPVHPSSRTSITITLNELPDLVVEEGSTPVCIGETMTFSNEVADGVWESSDTDVATVVDGVVTGISTGNATISYTVTYPSYPVGTTCTLTVEKEIEVKNCDCFKNPNPEESDEVTHTGISTMSIQSRNWPESIPNGFIVLESKNKGLVITRVPNVSTITEPKEGMIIYDIADSCIKLYNGIAWHCIQKDCD